MRDSVKISGFKKICRGNRDVIFQDILDKLQSLQIFSFGLFFSSFFLKDTRRKPEGTETEMFWKKNSRDIGTNERKILRNSYFSI